MAIALAAPNLPAASAPAREDAAKFLKREAQIDATDATNAARRFNRAALAAAAVHRGESAHNSASPLPKPPR